MLLDPRKKGSYFEKFWGTDLAKEAEQRAEEIFAARWKLMNADKSAGNNAAASQASRKETRRRRRRARSNPDSDSDSESDVDSNLGSSSPSQADTTSQSKPWLVDFEKYLRMPNSVIPINEDTDLVHWWGANGHLYPVWASLAQDYLAIMASSVSSERAFSSAGITITKRRNRLTHDIVEALQILKAAIREDLLFQPDQPSKAIELSFLLAQEEDFHSNTSATNAASSASTSQQVDEMDITLGTESDGIRAIQLSSS